MTQDFVHLHLHTEFSLLDGACRIGELLDNAVRQGMPAVAVTEHGNMFSAITFHDEARKRGIKPILGCEVYVANGSRFTRSGVPGETANHLVLLASSGQGFRNLVKLVSAGYTEGFYYKPRIDKDLLAEHADGLIGLSSCLKGEVATYLQRDQADRARAAAASFRDILGADNFFLELQYQGIDDQRVVNAGLEPISRDLAIPLVCTNDVHYVRQSDHRPHDVLLCIGTGKNVADEKRLRYHGDQFFLKSAEEMASVFGEFPEALANTVRIAERCDVDLSGHRSHLPVFDVPDGRSVDEYFETVVREGFQARRSELRSRADRGVLRHPIETYETKLSYEIDVIRKMQYAGYFLIVWDFIKHARERGIPVGPGRGSAAGSLVAYCLRITDVDPLEFGLIFERFLNPERVSLPDIDIDFCERRRGEVIDYVTQKYGRENVAQIITFGTMKARAVVRDVGRTLGMTYAEVDRVAKEIPAVLDMTLQKAIEENPALHEMCRQDTRVTELMDVAKRLEGVTRHASVHAAGVVIAPRPITEFAPLYKSQKNEITTQWAMKEIERIGLLKMDFLGLSTLTLLQDAVAQIKAGEDEVIALDELPLDDAGTYELFGRGQTVGIFQFESAGMRDTLRKAKPQRFEDLIALNALYRPGPLRAGVVDDFIARRHGKVEITYEVPELQPILEESYGVIAYQEQVMRIASDLAGFTLGEADLLRKAMGKKDAAVMEAQRERFVSGAVDRSIPRPKAEKIFGLIEFFAGYGFNKSHSTAYALLAYQTAYLKANYPWYFMAALLTSERQNPDKLADYLGECRDMAVPILPPDINASDLHFTVTPEGVRFGLAAVKNVGESAITSVLACRSRTGRVISLDQLCENVDLRLVNKRALESLVKAGAFDSLLAGTSVTSPAGRARLLAAVDPAVSHGGRWQRDRERGQSQLFGEPDVDEGRPDVRLPEAEPLTEAQQLAYEKEALGLYLSGHPVDRFARVLAAAGVVRIDALADRDGTVAAAGIITQLRPRKTRKGASMANVTLEDRVGRLDAVVFPEAYQKHRALLQVNQVVVVRGKLEQEEGEAPRLLVDSVQPIEAVASRPDRTVTVCLKAPAHDRTTVEALAEILSGHPGENRVQLSIELPHADPPLRVTAELESIRIGPSDDLVEAVERLCGRGAVSWA